jgi:hypothetical protein
VRPAFAEPSPRAVAAPLKLGRPSCDGTEPVSAGMGLCLRTSRTDDFAALGFAADAGGRFLDDVGDRGFDWHLRHLSSSRCVRRPLFLGVARFAANLRAGLVLTLPRFELFLRAATRFFALAMAISCKACRRQGHLNTSALCCLNSKRFARSREGLAYLPRSRPSQVCHGRAMPSGSAGHATRFSSSISTFMLTHHALLSIPILLQPVRARGAAPALQIASLLRRRITSFASPAGASGF